MERNLAYKVSLLWNRQNSWSQLRRSNGIVPDKKCYQRIRERIDYDELNRYYKRRHLTW